MSTLILEADIREWEKTRLAVRKRIANYSEHAEYFSSIEQLAFATPYKKKEVDEVAGLLLSFANAISTKDSSLAADLNKFVSLSKRLYSNPEFQKTAKRLKIASELIPQDTPEPTPRPLKPTPKPAPMPDTLEQDAMAWERYASEVLKASRVYDAIVPSLLELLFLVSGHQQNIAYEKYVKELSTFANQICGKDQRLAENLQNFIGVTNKYLKGNQMVRFTDKVRKRPIYREIEALWRNKENLKNEDYRRRQRQEEERRRQQEEERRRGRDEYRSREEERRREREEARRKNARIIKRVWPIALIVVLLAGGYQFVTWFMNNREINNYYENAETYLEAGKYQEAIEEYQSLYQIVDYEEQFEVNQRIVDVQNAADTEYNELLQKLQKVLKADRGVFNEDSDKLLDRMLEIYPDREESQQYKKKRDRQKR